MSHVFISMPVGWRFMSREERQRYVYVAVFYARLARLDPVRMN